MKWRAVESDKRVDDTEVTQKAIVHAVGGRSTVMALVTMFVTISEV